MEEIRKTVHTESCNCRECSQQAILSEIENLRAELARVKDELDEAQSVARELAEAIREIRDIVLNGCGPLECVLDNDQTNAVLSVIDDSVPATFSFVEAAGEAAKGGKGE